MLLCFTITLFRGLFNCSFFPCEADPLEFRVGLDHVRLRAVVDHYGVSRIDSFKDAALDIDDIGITVPMQLPRNPSAAVSH